MTLREKQSLFVRCLTRLLLFVELRGWELTLGEGTREDGRGHMRGSLHYQRLAQDLNLFVDGEWISDGERDEWTQIGEHWESLHPLCAWGGRFGDANHFSLKHGGRR